MVRFFTYLRHHPLETNKRYCQTGTRIDPGNPVDLKHMDSTNSLTTAHIIDTSTPAKTA